jgi:hypothetical protein
MTLPAAIRSKVRLWNRLAPRMQRHVTAHIPGLPAPGILPGGAAGRAGALPQRGGAASGLRAGNGAA